MRSLAAAGAALLLLGCSAGANPLPSAAAGNAGPGAGASTPSAPTASAVNVATSTTDAPRPAAKYNWTVMIYMDIDNNLEAEKIANSLGSAAKVGSTSDVNVIALVDRTPDNTADPVAPDANLGSIPDFTDAKLVKIVKNDYTEIKDLGEIDMGDPQTLAWFVQTGVTQYPANHYSLVFADHGGALMGAMWDDQSGKNLSVEDMRTGIAAGLKGTGVPKLDLIAYDACLMATYDTALSLAPLADWLAASEEVSLTTTYKYDAALNAIVGNPNATGEDMGKGFVDASVDQGWPIGTTSLIDLSKMGPIQQAVDSLGRALTNAMGTIADQLGRQRAQTLEFGIDPDTGENHGFGVVDLGDLTRRLGDPFPAEVQVARSAVFDAVQGATVDVKSGPAATAATGLSIYFPQSQGSYDPNYDSFPTGGDWRTMLKSYFQNAGTTGTGGTTTPGTGPKFESDQAQLQVNADGVVALAKLTADTASSAIDANLFGGLLESDGSIHYLMINPGTIGAGDALTVGGAWNFVYITLSDGQNTLETTTLIQTVPNAIRISVPLIYQAPDGTGGQVSLQFTLDQNGNVVDQPHFINYASDGSVSELTPAAGGVFAPLVFVQPQGGAPSLTLVSSTGLDAASLTINFTHLPSGSQFVAVLAASDANNNSAVASGVGTVP